MKKIEKFIEWAKNNSWDIKERNTEELKLCKSIIDRYENIPIEYIEFLNRVEQCISPSETSWILCEGEYNGTSDIEFDWNEFENISLEACEDDNELTREVNEFWNRHLPILMCVNGEYSFYAIDMKNKMIVYGYEPEFEEVEVVANDFFEFLELIMINKVKL